MDIRPATPADIPQLLALIRRYWEFEGIKGFEALRIEVVLQQTQSSWLANFASLANVTISNRAVAVVTLLPPVCMLALNPTAACFRNRPALLTVLLFAA